MKEYQKLLEDYQKKINEEVRQLRKTLSSICKFRIIQLIREAPKSIARENKRRNKAIRGYPRSICTMLTRKHCTMKG